MITRKAEARWEGELKGGRGSVRLGSGAFEGPYSFGTRFEGTPGTNPEELLGAAHAACFSMALAAGLARSGTPATAIETTATVTLDKVGEAFSITSIHLRTTGRVPGLAADAFVEAADRTRESCIVSRALASVATTVEATLIE